MQDDLLSLRIKAQTTEFNKQLDELNNKSKLLKATLKDIEQSKGIKSEEYAKAKQELKDAEKAAAALVKQLRTMDVSKMSMKELNLEAKNLAKEMLGADRNTKAYADNAKRLGEVESELGKAKKQANLLKQEGAALSMTWKDKVIKGFQDFGVVGVASMAAVGMAVKQAFSYIVDSFVDFDQAAADTKGELGLTQKQIAELREEAKKTGPEFGKTAKEMMEAYNAIGSGKSELIKTEGGLKKVTDQAIRLSTVAGMDMKDSANVMVESLNQYGKSANDAAKFVDILATGTKVGAAKINEISESLKYVGPVAKVAGVSFGQTNAALQVLAQSGIKGEMAGTSLRGTLLELAKSTDKTINPTIVGLQTAIENLSKKNYTAAQMSDLVGKTNVSAAIAMRDNAGKLKEWTAEIEKGGGAASMYADKTNTLKFQITQAKAIVLNYAVSFGEKLAPAISGVIKFALAFISTIAAIPKFIYDNRTAIGGLAVALIAFNAPLITSNALLLYNAGLTKGKVIWDKASAVATTLMTVATTGLNTAMKANPIGFVIGLLIGLGTIIYETYQRSQTFRAGLAGLWSLMKEGAAIISRIWTAMKNLDFKAVASELTNATTNMAKSFQKGYADKVKEESTKVVASVKKDGEDTVKNDAAKNTKLAKGIDELSDKQKKAQEDRKTANEEALKKIDELEQDAKLEHIRRMEGEVAYEKAKLNQKFEEEKKAIQASLLSKENKAVQIRLMEAKLDSDLEKLEEQNQKATADIVERWTEEEFVKKIKKAQDFANSELANARKHIKDVELLAKIETKINESLKNDIAAIKADQEAETIKKAEETAKKEGEISKKRLDAEKFILQQETEATKAFFDWKELDAKGNAKKLLKVQKERLDEELRLQKEKLRLEQQTEEADAKEKIKDKAVLEKALVDIQSKYNSLELAESRKVALEKIELEKKVKEEKEKVWKATSSAFSSLLKGDLNSFVEHLSSVNTAQQKSWQKELSGNMEKVAAVAQMAQAAVSFLNDLAQKKAERAIAEVQREYEFQKATIDKQLAENKDAISKAEDEKKAIKEAASEKIKSIKEQEEAKVKSLEDFYRSMSSADAKMDLQEQIDLTNQEAEAKIEAAKKAKEEATSNAREARDEKIIAAEAARDAEIASIKQRNNIDKAAKEELIARAKAKAEQEISIAKQEYDSKVKLSKEETEAKIKDATKEKEDKVKLMKQLQTADKEKAKELIDNAKLEAKEKVAAAEKEKNDKLRIVEQEKAKRVQEKKDLEDKMHEEDKKAKQKEYDLKMKAWKAQQKADIASALIGGALAIIKALAAGFPLGLVMAAVTAVMTGIQVAKIKNQAPPAMPTFAVGGLIDGSAHGSSYGKGGLAIIDRRTGREEGEMEGQEWIVDKHQTKANMPLLKAMKAKTQRGDRSPVAMPVGFRDGGSVDVDWNRKMYRYGGRVVRMYEDGGDIPSPESVSSRSAAASAAEGGESANADRDMAKKQAEEQLDNQKNQLIELKRIGEVLDEIKANTGANVGATNEVTQAVRDSNTNGKFDTLIGAISQFGSKAA